MAKQLTHLQVLFSKYLNNTISSAELQLFWQMVVDTTEDDPIHEDLRRLWKASEESALSVPDNYNYDTAVEHIKARAIQNERQGFVLNKPRWVWAAAAILIIIASASVFLFTEREKEHASLAEPASVAAPLISACKDCAILTLADGTSIELDSAAYGNLAEQGSTKIIKLNAGQLAYQAGANSTDAITYNTISTPNGGTYKVILPDGSNVWLNAASSVRFPTTFTGKKRHVEVKGEVFFEVKHNVHAPFVVTTNTCEIEVLGTSFNVNAYPEDQAIKTTLIEGSVKINAHNRSQKIKPGQQLSLHLASQKIEVTTANTEEVMAWKEGFFYFENADIQTIMGEIARWYNVEVEYENKVPSRGFKGEIGRDLILQDVVEFLRKSNVNVQLKGRKLIIKS